VRLARIYIRLARERADPRYLGRAEAVLARWWDDDAQPAVLVLRATIEQSLHEFDAALAHLDRALALAPGDVQGWLTRAVVLTVRGRHEEARASCARVATLGAAFAAEVCGTQVDSLTGAARPAHDRLAAAVERERAARGGISADEESWAESSLGEYAARFGDGGRAEAHFRRALELAPEDAYARAALADLWTDAGRFADAAALLAGREADDGMLLRLAIAEKRGGGARADEHDRTLAARFDASRARGDVVHRRAEARFWLERRGDPARALELARANWTVQKEPWDVRVRLAAALATRRPDEAAPVLDWVRRSRLEDPAIARLAAELGR
jgi:Tfp pilus assembly protein PilF